MLGVLFSRLSLRTSHIGFFFFFSSRRRHTRLQGDWSSDVCSSDLFYSTAGVAVTSIQWKVARQFAFFENNLSWKRYMTLYSSLQADEARTSPLPNGGSNPTGISQSYSSLHFQPFHHLGFGVHHNYFRSLPTYDPRLLGTGLLDQYLFQGFSGDVRVELVKHISVYASLGRSKATSDKKNSLNQAFGITLPNLLTGLLA